MDGLTVCCTKDLKIWFRESSEAQKMHFPDLTRSECCYFPANQRPVSVVTWPALANERPVLLVTWVISVHTRYQLLLSGFPGSCTAPAAAIPSLHFLSSFRISAALANQRPVSRSCDQYWPIRGQYSLTSSGPLQSQLKWWNITTTFEVATKKRIIETNN